MCQAVVKISLDKGHVNTLQTMEDALLAVFMPQNELLMRNFAKEGLMVGEGKLNMYLLGRNKQIKAKVLKRDRQDSPRTNSLPSIFLKVYNLSI